MIICHKCIATSINKGLSLWISETIWIYYKGIKKSSEGFSVLLSGSNLWHLKFKICDSQTVSRVVRCFPHGRKKHIPCCLIWRSVVIFTFNSQRQKNTFQHFCRLWFVPQHFSQHGSLQVIILSPSCAFDVSVEWNITSISFLLKQYYLITDLYVASAHKKRI